MPSGSDGHGHPEVEEAWPEADLERIQAVLGHPAPPESLDALGPASAAMGEPSTGVAPDDLVGPVEGESVSLEQGGITEAAIAPEPAVAAGQGEEAVETASAAADAPEATAPEAAPPEAAIPDEPAGVHWAAAAAAGASDVELIGVAPGQSLEDAIAAYESRLVEQERAEAEAASRAETEDVTEAMPTREAAPAVEPLSEPAIEGTTPPGELALENADRSAPEPLGMEPVAPAPELPDAAAAEATPAGPLAPPPAPTPTDVIAQPTWPVAPAGQPTSDGVPAPTPAAPPAPPAPRPTQAPEPGPGDAPTTAPATPWLRVAPDDDSAPAPQWPAAPAWPTASGREMPTTLAGRPLLPRDDASALWAASAREVLGPPSATGPTPSVTVAPQPCVQCGLSLSANARFCRRCGSRQG